MHKQMMFKKLMYNFIQYSDANSKTSGSLWQYYRHEPALDNNGNIIDFPDDNNSASFKFKQKKQDKQELVVQKMLNQWFH